MSSRFFSMNNRDAMHKAEDVFDALRELRAEAERRGHADIAEDIRTALLDVGVAITDAGKACERSNARLQPIKEEQPTTPSGNRQAMIQHYTSILANYDSDEVERGLREFLAKFLAEKRCSCGKGGHIEICGVCEQAKCLVCWSDDQGEDRCADCKRSYEEMREAEERR